MEIFIDYRLRLFVHFRLVYRVVFQAFFHLESNYERERERDFPFWTSRSISFHNDFISLGAELYIARHFVRHALVGLRCLVQYYRFRTFCSSLSFALDIYVRISFCVISGNFSSDLYGFWPRLHHRLSICLQQFPKML